jgi:iron complex outermembrane receptor protein
VSSRILSVFLLLFSAQLLRAQETTQETSENYETIVRDAKFVSSSKVILDQEAIRKTHAPNISSLLASQANISIVNTSFQPGQIYLRGGDASHVLILLDGLPFYEPTALNRQANINQIDVKTIRRIEILKGTQSVLYGGQALSGVIKIETFPRDFTSRGSTSVELGEREYKKISDASIHQIDDHQALVREIQYQEKKNRSPVLESSVDYPSRLASANLNYIYSENMDVFLKVGRSDEETSIATADRLTGIGIDATDFQTRTTVSSFSTGLIGKNWTWRPQLLLGYLNSYRRYSQPSTSSDLKYLGDLWNLRLETLPVDLENLQVTLGASYNHERLRQKESLDILTSKAFQEISSVFLKFDSALTSAVELEGGVRSDFVLFQDRQDTYQAGLVFQKNLKFEYSTGYKTASLSQRYGYGGNSDLKSEQARTYSVDCWTALSPSLKASFTVFESDFDNLIVFQPSPLPAPATGMNINLAKTQTRGVESQLSWTPAAHSRFDASLGYQEPWDIGNARQLVRRPKETGSLRWTESFEKDQWMLETIYNGGRLDQSVKLSPYQIANFSYTKQISARTSTYVRGNNIFNTRYEQTYSYYDEGSFWLLGMEFRN